MSVGNGADAITQRRRHADGINPVSSIGVNESKTRHSKRRIVIRSVPGEKPSLFSKAF
jgi:hypothetical protein